jgi:hypothetical protein
MRDAESAATPPGPALGDLCGGCRHYHVTWDIRRPHGCRALRFKSSRRPCRIVYESSGEACRSFEARPERRPERGGQPG